MKVTMNVLRNGSVRYEIEFHFVLSLEYVSKTGGSSFKGIGISAYLYVR